MASEYDDTLRAFRRIKENIHERGTAAVAAEWAAADRLPTVAVIREMAGMTGLSLSHLDDRIIAGWLAGARSAILAGQSLEAVRDHIAALVVEYGDA